MAINYQLIIVADTLADLPTAPANDGQFAYALDTKMCYRYSVAATAWVLDSTGLGKAYSVTTTSGTAVVQLTDDGLSTGNPLFSQIDFVSTRFALNDPNLSCIYALTNSNKTLTITAAKQTFNGITVVGIPVLGSNTIAAVANGTAITVYVQGKLN